MTKDENPISNQQKKQTNDHQPSPEENAPICE
jgi:hypothetical protein